MKNNQTDVEQSQVRNCNEVGENQTHTTDDEQHEVQHDQAAGANKPVSQFYTIRAGRFAGFSTFESLLYFTWIQAAGCSHETNQKKVCKIFPDKKGYKQQVLHAPDLGIDKLVFH